MVRRLKWQKDRELFSFSQGLVGKNLHLTEVFGNLAAGISYSENAQPELESEEPYIVIHANAKICSG
jgi:hypothetical protein